MPVEREIKLSVGDEFVLPDWREIAVIANNLPSEELISVYYDTNELTLAQTGWGLRYRQEAGGNVKWTLKGRAAFDGDAVMRDEFEVEAGPEAVPDELRSYLPAPLRRLPLIPVARLKIWRQIIDARDASKASCELVDDRVDVLTEDQRKVDHFREVEIEFGVDSHDLARRIAAFLKAHGASPSLQLSKYQRAQIALGLTSASS